MPFDSILESPALCYLKQISDFNSSLSLYLLGNEKTYFNVGI